MQSLELNDMNQVNGGLASTTFYDFDLLLGQEIVGCRVDIIGWESVTTKQVGLFDTTYVVTEQPILAFTPYYKPIIANGLI